MRRRGRRRQRVGHLPPTYLAPEPHAFSHFHASSPAMAAHVRTADSLSLVQRLTVLIKETYSVCNPNFAYSELNNPKCPVYLTKPSEGISNDGLDNQLSDLILIVNNPLINGDTGCRYIVQDMLGQGTFGQVAKCLKEDTNEHVAVKVIKNQPAYYQQALVEISILRMLNQKYDTRDEHHIVRLHDHFVYQRHLCLVFELLKHNLFELIKENDYQGLSISLVRLCTKQILNSLSILRDANVIHCDLKPENILLKSYEPTVEIKLIDFGSACMEDRTVYSYIQSRFYRSPEVLLGHPYTVAIDMWSLGCVAAELFLGLPLFPGASEYDIMQRMLEFLRTQPPDHILRAAKNTTRFFKRTSAAPPSASLTDTSFTKSLGFSTSSYTFMDIAEFEARENVKVDIGKRYFKQTCLEDVVLNYSLRKGNTPEEIAHERTNRLAFVDFLQGLINFDPVKRWTPRQAAQHPFLTEKPFTGPFTPPPEAPRTPVGQVVNVAHNPSKGHWAAAGLSPQVMGMHGRGGVTTSLNVSSPQHLPWQPYGPLQSQQSLPGSFGTSHGTSHSMELQYGSSYPDASSLYISHFTPPSAAAIGRGGLPPSAQGLGQSPTEWRQGTSSSHVIASCFGQSPSSSGTLYSMMSLGASPSQYTPPSSHQFASHSSPGCPSFEGNGRPPALSPIRQGSLGKAAAVGQYHKRRGSAPGGGTGRGLSSAAVHPLGSGGSPAGTTFNEVQQQRQQVLLAFQHQQQHLGVTHSQVQQRPELLSDGSAGRRKAGSHPGYDTFQGPQALQSERSWLPGHPHGVAYASTTGGPPEGAPDDLREDSSPPPNPSDWDPYYSDELLLEEETSGPSSSSTLVMGSGGARQGSGPGHLGQPANTFSRFQLPPAAITPRHPVPWSREVSLQGPGHAVYHSSPPGGGGYQHAVAGMSPTTRAAHLLGSSPLQSPSQSHDMNHGVGGGGAYASSPGFLTLSSSGGNGMGGGGSLHSYMSARPQQQQLQQRAYMVVGSPSQTVRPNGAVQGGAQELGGSLPWQPGTSANSFPEKVVRAAGLHDGWPADGFPAGPLERARSSEGSGSRLPPAAPVRRDHRR
eukprot:SM000032S12037  [mRNA]  locus=s32:132845:140561:+ [translate_table: standard]